MYFWQSSETDAQILSQGELDVTQWFNDASKLICKKSKNFTPSYKDH